MANYSYSDEVVTNDNLESAPVNSSTKDLVGDMLLQSMSLIGIPYKWGGNTPDSGLDCSGFIRYVFKKSLGINLPRTAAGMARLGRNIPLDQLAPGDLLFFNTLGGRRISHIGMYLGNNKFIQSPHTGQTIQITDFDQYYHSKFVVAKRMVEEDVDNNGQAALTDLRDEQDSFTIKNSVSAKPHTRVKAKHSRGKNTVRKTKKHKSH